MFRQPMDDLEAVLDAVKAELARDNKSGGWLRGPSSTVAHVGLSVLLARLHQLGLNGHLWKGDVRPTVAVCQERAMERPSLKKATRSGVKKDEEDAPLLACSGRCL